MSIAPYRSSRRVNKGSLINQAISGIHPRRRFLKNSSFFLAGFALAGVTGACSPISSNQATNSAGNTSGTRKAIRIGYQKFASNLNLLKNQGSLEKRLQPDGGTVEWNEFVAGPQMLEALNVGSIDIAYTGETPPIFAQAAGAPLVYVAYEPVGPKAEAILVHQDSSLQTVADLKGKKVVLNKGSNVHYLLVKALEEAGLSYSDIEAVYLPPGDAHPVFEQKNVDAWVIWDPFQASAELDFQARILRDGQGIVENRGFYLANKSFIDTQPETLDILLEELDKINVWATENQASVVEFLAAELGVPETVTELAETRRG
ncbi:sulfonate ABC transporter substrate-binding protein [Synechococcus moorigangaii CMS01]|nr:sulfonate ABC transporter substrate-binding protein [Synechococcus moorigangaii CMS01]